MTNVKLIIAYDGGRFLGWQKTKEGPSIEEELQRVLEHIYQTPIQLQAASRTDAGVHAAGQVVNFFPPKLNPCPKRLSVSINSLLPKDISVLSSEIMPQSFHPTLDAKGKEYRYYISCGKSQMPHHRFYAWHYPYQLDLDKINEALPFLIGSKDFSTFCNFKKNAAYTDFIRTVDSIQIENWEESGLCFKIQGNHFLYKMVRNLVGTLVYIGRGKVSIKNLSHIVESHDRTQAGMTAPAHGLFLHRVFY